MIRPVLRMSVLFALTTGGFTSLGFAHDTFSLKGLPHDRLDQSSTSEEITSSARDIDSEADLQEINLRYRLGYVRGWYGGTYLLPRTYAWRAGYWHGYYGYPSYARYWVSYPTYYYSSCYHPWVTTTYYYSVPSCWSSSTIVYDACTIPIRAAAVAPSPSVPAASGTPAEALPRSLPGVPSQVEPMKPPMPLPPQPGEPAPKSTKPDGGDPPTDVRLVRESPEPKRFRYPAYGEHIRSSDSMRVHWARNTK